ncbi:MAG: thiamine-monophosphate kinase [Planctomycetota bacterium]|nr:MAG: thiamine-monophosphate kinase [Planctomycetota bacterium]
MNESDLLAHIFTLSGGINAGAGDVLVGPGDDCAVVRTPSGDTLLLTVDQLVEGRHFETGTPIDLIARKAVARSISDIAAMGGEPSWGLATGLLPDGYQHGRELSEALHKWGNHWHCPIVGGDIAFGPGPLSITTTVVGRMGRRRQRAPGASRGTRRRHHARRDNRRHARPPRSRGALCLRSSAAARAGDELWLTGQVGGSFDSGWHLRFEPRLAAGHAAARSGRVHAMIDLSDGLGRDASRIGVASNMRLMIDAAKLPVSHRARDWAQAAGEGEDYELLMAIHPRHPEITDPPLTLDPPLHGPIGIVRACEPGEKPGATIIDPYGKPHDAESLGWDHGA